MGNPKTQAIPELQRQLDLVLQTAALRIEMSSNVTVAATAPSRTRNGSQPHTRSLGGCLTCRSRKVKCDELQPTCQQCVRSGLRCGGYKAKIRFVHYRSPGVDPLDREGACGRRTLFTVAERSAMSQQMLERVAVAGNVDQILEELEEIDSDRSNNLLSERGPFMVFQLQDDVSTTEKENLVSITRHEGDLPQPWQLLEGVSASSTPVGIQGMSDLAMLPDPTDSFDFDMLDSMLLTANSDLMSPSIVETFPPIPAVEGPYADTIEALFPQPRHDLHQNSLANLPAQSYFLLEHYKSLVSKTFSPIHKRKSPWSILHLPRAMLALAEISIFKTTEHAHTSLFYSVLAVSAFNLDNLFQRQRDGATCWKSTGDGFRRAAQKALQSTCETEASGKNQSKYKDVLMAILSMVTISVVTGQQEEARSYLLNAEMFICFRGIRKAQKSKKVKLLHWIYLFLRIVQESTHMYDPSKQQPMDSLTSTEHMTLPSLRTHSKNIGTNLDTSVGCDFEQGLFGDLEVFRDGLLFQNIYGLPFQLLSFISRTTFLANEILALKCREPGVSMTPDIESRCAALETELCGWANNKATSEPDDEDEDAVSALVNRTIMAHLIAAFHNASIIFFYRRVRQLNPLLLQHLAEQTLAHLEAFEQEQQRFSVCNCEIVWPAFIAGAEALEQALQDRFNHHLRDCASRSGMRNFETAADFLQELWESRRTKGNEAMTWVDLMRAKKVSLILT